MSEEGTQTPTAGAESGGKSRTMTMTDPRTGQTVSRADFIRDVYKNGATLGEGIEIKPFDRGAITKYLDKNGFEGIKFQTVFAATKGMTPEGAARGGNGGGGGNKGGGKTITVDGKQVSRSDYIKQLFREGLTRKGIQAKLEELGESVHYGTLYQISMKLKDEGVEIAKDPPNEAKPKRGGKKGSDEPEAEGAALDPDAPAFEEEELGEATDDGSDTDSSGGDSNENEDEDSVVP